MLAFVRAPILVRQRQAIKFARRSHHVGRAPSRQARNMSMTKAHGVVSLTQTGEGETCTHYNTSVCLAVPDKAQTLDGRFYTKIIAKRHKMSKGETRSSPDAPDTSLIRFK